MLMYDIFEVLLVSITSERKRLLREGLDCQMGREGLNNPAYIEDFVLN